MVARVDENAGLTDFFPLRPQVGVKIAQSFVFLRGPLALANARVERVEPSFAAVLCISVSSTGWTAGGGCMRRIEEGRAGVDAVRVTTQHHPKPWNDRMVPSLSTHDGAANRCGCVPATPDASRNIISRLDNDACDRPKRRRVGRMPRRLHRSPECRESRAGSRDLAAAWIESGRTVCAECVVERAAVYRNVQTSSHTTRRIPGMHDRSRLTLFVRPGMP